MIYTAAGTGRIRGLGLVVKDDVWHLVAAVHPGGAEPEDYLVVRKWTVAGGWGTAVQDAQLYSAIHSLGCALNSAGKILICIARGYNTIGDEYKLTTRYRNVNVGSEAWEAGVNLLTTGAYSDYRYTSPNVLVSDSVIPRYLFTWMEGFAGSPSHTRGMLCCTPVDSFLTEWHWIGGGLVGAASYGNKLLRTASYWYLIHVKGAYRCAVYSEAANEKVNVSQDVKAFELKEYGTMRPSHLWLVLENGDSRYQNAGVSGAYQAVKEGARVALGLGYVTSAGNEYRWSSPFWIDSIEYHDDPVGGSGEVLLECIDAWEYLERFKVQTEVSISGETMGSILRKIWWRVSGEQTFYSTAGLGLVVSRFTFRAGES
ncbi:MAG: hypothetical protein Q8P59_13085, partial [Dehalococcoidia bacterium]|nr:hypothetical protein [Dehalococcoidia bacterium]